jgi:predicted nucleic acid-binding protein
VRGYLLDTNHLTRLRRKHPDRDGALLKKIAALEDGTALYASIISVGELWLGIDNAPIEHREKLLEETQQMLREDLTGILPIDEGVAKQWGEMMVQIPKGQHTGGNDSWIAATALAHDLILLTADPDFDVVPRLQKENWLR